MKHRLAKHHAIYQMSANHPPALVVEDGDPIVFETYDCKYKVNHTLLRN